MFLFVYGRNELKLVVFKFLRKIRGEYEWFSVLVYIIIMVIKEDFCLGCYLNIFKLDLF